MKKKRVKKAGRTRLGSAVNIPDVTDLNYGQVLTEHKIVYGKFPGEMRDAHLFFSSETDGFTQMQNISKGKDVAAAWERHKKATNKIIRDLDKNYRGAYTPTYSEGSKYRYTKDLKLVELATLIRKELEIEFEGWKFSVTTEHHTALGVRILFVPYNPFSDGYQAHLKADTGAWHDYRPSNEGYARRYEYYLDRFSKDLEKIESIREQYNYNDSDSQTDYFHVRYYGSVSVDQRAIVAQYYPNNTSLKKDLARDKEWEEKRIAANKKAKSAAGKFKKEEVVFFNSVMHSSWHKYKLPNGLYLAEIAKSPNGRAQFSKYVIYILANVDLVNPETLKRNKERGYDKYYVKSAFGTFHRLSPITIYGEEKLLPLNHNFGSAKAKALALEIELNLLKIKT